MRRKQLKNTSTLPSSLHHPPYHPSTSITMTQHTKHNMGTTPSSTHPSTSKLPSALTLAAVPTPCFVIPGLLSRRSLFSATSSSSSSFNRCSPLFRTHRDRNRNNRNRNTDQKSGNNDSSSSSNSSCPSSERYQRHVVLYHARVIRSNHHYYFPPCATRQPVAVQARPVSGDSDGEVRNQADPGARKSFSVAVTIVSDCDARLRRNITERIVADADAGRIVVVTTAGLLTANDSEPDGFATTPIPSTTASAVAAAAPVSTTTAQLSPTTTLTEAAATQTVADKAVKDAEIAQNTTSPGVSAPEDQSPENSETKISIPSDQQQTASALELENDSSLNDSSKATVTPGEANAGVNDDDQQQPQQELRQQPGDGEDRANGYDPSDGSPAQGSQFLSAVSNLEGWISCSSPEEMVEVVLKLSASKECDYIIAECAANDTIEPQELASILDRRGGSTLRVDGLVSVIDGDTLLQDLSALPATTTNNTATAPSEDDLDDFEPAADTSNALPTTTAQAGGAAQSSPTRPIADTPQRAMTLVKLVENANVIVLRQSSVEEPDNLSRVQSVVSVLNGGASIVPATDDIVPVDLLVNTNTYDNATLKLGATWKRVLQASRNLEAGSTKPPALPKSLKEATFLYKARRPFHPERLYQQIKAVATFKGVIRSTGKLWLATRMDAPLEWNQAGVSATLRTGKPFLASIPETEWKITGVEREKIVANWDNQHGDRETEMVFVGINIDKTRLQGLLDGCLLHDEEIVFAKMWENFEDPFVEWVPLTEEDEDELDEENNVSIPSLTTPKIVPQTEEQQENEKPLPVAANDAQSLPGEEKTDELPGTTTKEEEGSSRMKDEIIEIVEEETNPENVPEDLTSSKSALDILHFDETAGDNPNFKPLPEDDGEYNEEDVVIASWDGTEADGILTQIPRLGLPVTILTGFLGSGKTTVLNYILKANHGFRVAVLVNEFGEIDIDNQLVEKGEWTNDGTDDILELANGCICCSINDSFVASVSKILDRRDAIDYLLIETTGVADPVPVINSLMTSDIANDVRVDGILTVVDAENFDTDTHMGSEAALSQIMTADTILLSKTDIATKEKTEETIGFIQSVRPAARILKSQRGRVPIKLILDVGVRVTDSPAHLHPVNETEASEERSNDHEHDHDHDHEHAHAHKHDHNHEHNHEHDHSHDHDHDFSDTKHEHGPNCNHDHDHSHDHGSHSHQNHLEADGFVTTSFKSDIPIDPELFMSQFLQRLPQGVFRAKGLLSFYGYGSRYIFQLSGRRYEFEEDEWPEGVAPGNQLVIIGRDLDLEKLRETLESCHADV